MTDGRRVAVLACLAAAVLADLGTIHAHHTDDSILFSLASTHAWRPFFWEQDRVGLLVPLLASPVEHPWYNLLLQVGVTAFLGLLVPVLAAGYVRPGPTGLRAGLLATAALVAVGPPVVRNHVLFECNYPTALAFGFAALWLLDRPRPGWGRAAVAFVLFSLGCWVYATLPLGLLPLVAFRSWQRSGFKLLAALRDPQLWAASLTLLAGFAVGLAVTLSNRPDTPDYQPTNPASLSFWDWPGACLGFVNMLIGPHEAVPWLTLLAALFAAGLLTAAGRSVVPFALPLLLAGLTEFAFVCTREWPTHNHYHPRYYLASLLYLGPAALLPLAERIVVPVWAAGLMLVGATVYQYGPPSLANARAALYGRTGQYTDELLECGADAVGGMYWEVWSTCHHVNLVRHERGDRRPFHAVGYRCSVWRPIWEREHPAGFVVAVFRDGSNFFQVCRQCRLNGLTDPVPAGKTPRFDLFRVAPRPASDPL